MTASPPADAGIPLKPALRIVSLEGAPEIAEAVVDLHLRLLPTSPVVLLGRRFMRDFYYALLPAHGFIQVLAAFVNDVPAGFIAVTTDPDRFMGIALRRWWHRLAWVLFVSVLAQPATRIAALWEAFQIMRARTGESHEPGTAELLSLGVLPEFTDPKFVHESGLRIARELVASGVNALAAKGARSVFAVVDADNLPARMMYFGLGWRLSRNSVPGWRVPSVEFAWDINEPGR